MHNDALDTSISKAARAAGFMFLFTFIGPLFYGAFLFPKLTAAGNAIATANNIIANELLFRIGIINELICSAGAVVFALVLYIILKPVNKNLTNRNRYRPSSDYLLTCILMQALLPWYFMG